MPVELVVTRGPNTGLAFRFTEHRVFLVGRSPDSHFVLPDADPYVSRHQFVVEVNPPLVRLRDAGSRSGTRVNGVRVADADLRDGDEIRVGVTTLKIRVEPDSAAVPFGACPTADPTAAGSPGVPDLAPAGYRILREIGRGGMGVVYEARHTETGQPVAVKTILPRARAADAAVKKFLREADIVRRLDHPNIVRFVASGEHAGVIWFAMEYVPGPDAERLANREGRPGLPVDRVGRWGVQLLAGLGAAHRAGVVHRDVKPSNLIVSGTAGGELVKLADFGLARAFEASAISGLTLTGAVGGTPPFMPPEQVRDTRTAKPAADIYSAGATLYRLLTGRYPYPTPEHRHEIFKQILETDPVPIERHRPDLPPPLAAAIGRALARNPSDRFPDADAFAAAVSPFAAGRLTGPQIGAGVGVADGVREDAGHDPSEERPE